MTNMKPVRMWEPKRADKRNASGIPIDGEFVGKFRMKVPEGTVGAIHYTGSNDAGKEWDFWGIEVDSINGVVRWIDVRSGEFDPVIVIFLESPKALNQITIRYDVSSLHTVMNHLCGLGKDIATAHINISYWVRKKTNREGALKLNNNGDIIWAKDLYFTDVPQAFSFDEWKTFAAENGLEWFQETRKGKKEWNNEAEQEYWMKRVVAMQRFLLSTPDVLPFCWNSMTACKGEQKWGTLTEAEIEKATEIYERIKGDYKFPYSRTIVSADDVDIEIDPEYSTAPGPTTQPTATGRQPDNARPVAVPDGFPTDDLTSHSETDDLPF